MKSKSINKNNLPLIVVRLEGGVLNFAAPDFAFGEVKGWRVAKFSSPRLSSKI